MKVLFQDLIQGGSCMHEAIIYARIGDQRIT